MVKTLPGMEKPKKTKNQLATEYISNLHNEPVYRLHKTYFHNYLHSGYPVIMSHIRNAYLKYVLSNKWPKEKFDFVLYVLISNEKTLSNNAFENMGTEYDNGKIKYEKFYADAKNNLIKTDTSEHVTDDELYNFLNNNL